MTLLDCCLRLGLALACGYAIGYERGNRLKQAGVRTHVIVILGACLMTIVSKYGYTDLSGAAADGLLKWDASRIASQIVTGVSFLGAGMIIMHHRTVTGLTTAAGIWTTAGIGMAIGAGLYWAGIITTALVILVQTAFRGDGANTFGMQTTNSDITVKVENNGRYISNILDFLEDSEVEIIALDMIRLGTTAKLELTLGLKNGADLPRLVEKLQMMGGVKSVKM